MRPFRQKKYIIRPGRGLLSLAIAFLFSLLAVYAFSATAGAGEDASATNTQPVAALDLQLAPFASGLNQPVGIVSNGDRRLFVLEKKGVIKIVQADGNVEPAPFLDISERVDSSASETGLLGLAFHPDYFANGAFYLNYTNLTDDIRRTRISRFSVTADPNVADPNSEEILLTVVQPASNHNAGHIMFGPDGFLYIPLGDGGGSGRTVAQDMTSPLGKILRIDVNSGAGLAPDCQGDGTGNYTVPNSNPLTDGPGDTCDEIWASGLRNPWRSSFDKKTGDLFIGDVGQNTWEEIDTQPAASPGGENYGWPCYEASAPFNTGNCGPVETYTFPIFEYSHTAGGCSVTGGAVYRGSRYPAMAGRYLLADFCSGHFWDLVPGSSDWTATRHDNVGNAYSIVAFGEACDGELYVANIGNGQIYHLQDNGLVAAGGGRPVIQAPADFTADSWLYFPLIAQSACR